MSLKAIKYRIQTNEDETFRIQYKLWFWPFWIVLKKTSLFSSGIEETFSSIEHAEAHIDWLIRKANWRVVNRKEAGE